MIKASACLRIVAAVAAILTAGLLLETVARSQGMSAQMTAPEYSPRDDIKLLRQQLIALTGRVHELEKKAEDVKNNADDDAQTKKIEQRLAAIENAQAKLEHESTNGKHAEVANDAGTRVQAPFVVYDHEGHEIFRVDLGLVSKQPKVIIGTLLGAHIAMGLTSEQNSRIELYERGDPTHPKAMLHAGKQSFVKVISEPGEQQTILGSDPRDRYGLFIWRGNIGSVSLTSKPSGAGEFTLTDPAGNFAVNAGTLEDGKGIVRTGPKCCKPPGPIGPHEYITGRTH